MTIVAEKISVREAVERDGFCMFIASENPDGVWKPVKIMDNYADAEKRAKEMELNTGIRHQVQTAAWIGPK